MTSVPIHSEASRAPTHRGLMTGGLTAMFAVAAIITVGYWGWQGLGREDTEALESPLMLSVARQLVSGPGGLYGPFGADNRLVLIHAPLYYRISALAAWPMARAGADPVTAARIAGRLISALSLLATLMIAYRLARLGGGSRLAGWWAAMLVASAPILAGQPFAVRPDMLGIALQSAGLLLVLSAMGGGTGSVSRIVWGYAAFGLALCVKQHLLAELAVCTLILLLSRRDPAIPIATISRGLTVCLAIAATVYGVEWVITQGEIWQATYVAARQVGKVYPGGWPHVTLILYGLVRRDAGLLTLLPMIGLTMVGIPRGILRKLVMLAGIAPFGVILANLTAYLFANYHELEIPSYFISLSAGLAFLICGIIARPNLLGDRNDSALWLCIVAELILVLFLSYLSTGSWMNYGIQAVVLGCVIAARAGARVVELAPSARALWPISLGALAVLGSSYIHIMDADLQARNDRAAAAKIIEQLNVPRNAVFFVDHPGFNRIGGRLDLVYDHWLYRVFESSRLAESRSAWIAQALATRDLRAVVTTSERPVIEGTGLKLQDFAFRPAARAGHYYAWLR